jgi:hypothetical protein
MVKNGKTPISQPIADVVSAKLDRTTHLYYLNGQEVGAVQWYREIKKWILIGDRNNFSVLRRDDIAALVYVIDAKILEEYNSQPIQSAKS